MRIADLTANEVDAGLSFPTVPDIDIILRLGWGRAGWCLPAATGGSGTVTYSVAPTLPTGLSFNSTYRAVWGNPTTVQAASAYTLTATDGDDDTDTLDFKITILANTLPSFGAATISAKTYVKDVEIAALQLPAATGGDGAIPPILTPDHLLCERGAGAEQRHGVQLPGAPGVRRRRHARPAVAAGEGDADGGAGAVGGHGAGLHLGGGVRGGGEHDGRGDGRGGR